MASNYVDDFVLNFDLNQLTPEENVQAASQSQKYDRIRKSTTWLKSKIISTDYVIQKYQMKKDDYEQSVKELSATKEELKQVLINYKEATERCVALEKENKTLLANQEVLQGKFIDAETKYDALKSHTNQLQMLVKDLETAREALIVEKELAKCNNKNGGEEYKALQNENDSMLKDLRALKDVILGKKKANKRHVKLIKKYEKDIKRKGARIECKSDESGDEINDCGDILPRAGIKLSEVSNHTDNLNAEQSFIDNYSDGEISVDTGRGSSRANSHDKFISSPDYVVTLENLTKLPSKDVVQRVDAANSPITVYPNTSVATSPIMFDNSTPIFVAGYENYTDCTDDVEYIIDGTDLSEEICDLEEQENLADCASPAPDLSNIISGGTSPIKNYEVYIVKETDMSPSDKSYFIESIDPVETDEFDQSAIIDKKIRRCVCEKSDTPTINGNIELNDACTSPLTIADDTRQYVDKGINTDENVNISKTYVNVGTNTNSKIQFAHHMARMTDRSSNNIRLPEKELIDASTNTDSKKQFENQMARMTVTSSNTIILPEKESIDASTNTDSEKQFEDLMARMTVVSSKTIILPEKETVDSSTNTDSEKQFEKQMARMTDMSRNTNILPEKETVDASTNTDSEKQFENQMARTTDMSSNTIKLPEKETVDASIHSDLEKQFEDLMARMTVVSSKTIILPEKETVDSSTNTDSEKQFEKQMARMTDMSRNTNILPEKETVDASTNTDSEKQFENQMARTTDMSSNTIKLPEKETVDASIHSDLEKEFENQMARKTDKSSNNIRLPEKVTGDVSTNTDLTPIKKSKVVDRRMDIVSKMQMKKSLLFDKQIPKSDTISNNKRCLKRNNNTINGTEELRNQEKVCLESNSSKQLHFESSNDAEVQNILKVMKLRHDLISPISKTPCDWEYLKLIPEMNYTLTKIWSTIANIYRTPNQSRNVDVNYLQSSVNVNNFENIPGIEINNSKRISDQEEFRIDRSSNPVVADDVIDRRDSTCNETSTAQVVHNDNTCLECPNMAIDESPSETVSKTAESDIVDDKFVSHSTTNKVRSIKEDKRKNRLQQQIENSPGDISNCDKTDETILTVDVNKEIDSQQQCKLNYSMGNEICEDNLNNITNTDNNFETSHITETSTSHTIIVNDTKSNKKSKLEKFRTKLLPTCKIKKEILSNKHLSKTFVKPKNITSSPSLNQKLAYENAVKVIAELRSSQELQEKRNSQPLTTETKLENKSSTSKTSPSQSVESNMLLTRSRTRRLSKKEDVTASPEKTNDIEMSPVNRRLRKRSADTEVDSLRCNYKRILRSSNVPHDTNEKVLQEGYSDNMANQLQNLSDNFNPENNNCASDSDHAVGAKSDITLEKNIRNMKPVIELSECLADNTNAVSIIPGKVGYFDVNKNNNQARKLSKLKSNKLSDKKNCSEVNQLNLDTINNGIMTEKSIVSPNTNNYVTHGDKVTNSAQEQSSEINGMVAKDDDTANKYSNDNQGDFDKREHSKQNSPKATTKQNIQTLDSGATTTKHDITNLTEEELRKEANIGTRNPVVQLIPLQNDCPITNKNNIVSYRDLDLYTEGNYAEDTTSNSPLSETRPWKQNILCTALDRYGVISVKYVAKKVPDAITLQISQMIEESITNIIASSKSEQKSKMNDLVGSMQNFKVKQILAGLMKYLKDPTRKNELFNKIINGCAPPMTKSEVILLYVIESLNGSFHGFINRLWNNMEHALFQLNRSPNFDVIESISHFYAVLCRYFRSKSRLRCFMLDAMYCLQFKAVPLIRQCLDVCPGVLPNAHENMAKTSLVTCLVYLLHFYKCQDKYNRAQDVRNILYQRYQYRFSEWNETVILETFRKAILDLRGTRNDKKMLRVALIILCKRHGAKWSQLNIIQNMLLPTIEKNVPDKIKQFCVLMLGPLLKPFPADRKAQCEIVINRLLQMSKQNTTQEMKEAIYSSLIFMNKHDSERVVQALLSWNPDSVSSEFEAILNDFVMEKPLALWKRLVTKNPSQIT